MAGVTPSRERRRPGEIPIHHLFPVAGMSANQSDRRILKCHVCRPCFRSKPVSLAVHYIELLRLDSFLLPSSRSRVEETKRF